MITVRLLGGEDVELVASADNDDRGTYVIARGKLAVNLPTETRFPSGGQVVLPLAFIGDAV